MRAFSLFAVVAIFVGCVYDPTTSLKYDPIAVRGATKTDRVLAVRPLTEARGAREYPSFQGRLFLTYIPLLPYVKIPYERLDESHVIHQQKRGRNPQLFPERFAREIARDLGQSGMFREVRFAATEGEIGNADLILSGNLKSSEFDIYATSYMLGAPGVLLWLLPIPIGMDAATVTLDLTLRDRAGAELWSHSATSDASKLFTFYNAGGRSTSSRYRISIKRYGSNDFGIDGDSLWAYHAEALRAAIGDSKASLVEYLSRGL